MFKVGDRVKSVGGPNRDEIEKQLGYPVKVVKGDA